MNFSVYHTQLDGRLLCVLCNGNWCNARPMWVAKICRHSFEMLFAAWSHDEITVWSLYASETQKVYIRCVRLQGICMTLALLVGGL